MTQLLSVACLSLASKMEETLVPLLLDLQQVLSLVPLFLLFWLTCYVIFFLICISDHRLAMLSLYLKLELYKEWSFWFWVHSNSDCKQWHLSHLWIIFSINLVMEVAPWNFSFYSLLILSWQWLEVCFNHV
jgi:Cyclin, N-terminal domain